ncbi:MAG: zinc-ribbon domain-containing protein [Alphaproteobacteria bacterium]
MIVTCDKCQKRYLIKDEAIGAEGRKVRCVACGNVWRQSPDDMVSKGAPVKPVRRKRAHIATPKKKKFAWGWIIFLLVLLGSIAGFIYGKGAVIKMIPGMASVYDSIGMSLAPSHAGLVIDAPSHQHINKDGKTYVVISGEIVNTTEEVKIIPPIQLQLRGPCKSGEKTDPACLLDSWTHEFSEKRVLPGERAAFETEPHPTPKNADKIVVKF